MPSRSAAQQGHQESAAADQAGEAKSTRKSSSTPSRWKRAWRCLEDGKLEEFTIERTTEERLVGSIFKGKVRNLEDGLKAAFVDIGFEKNAFLHYWDIVPSNFDSGVEIVEREGNAAAKNRRSRRRTSRGSILRAANHRAGDQGADRHQRPARHHQSRAARPLSRAAAELRPERYLAQDREPGGTPAPERSCASLPSRTAWA